MVFPTGQSFRDVEFSALPAKAPAKTPQPRRDEEAAAIVEIIEDSPTAEVAGLPPPGALHAARTTTMAAAFYRLIAVVLGEPYRPPVNLQDRIDRLQRARDIIQPYRYDSFERVLDHSAINVELVQLGRMLDEL